MLGRKHENGKQLGGAAAAGRLAADLLRDLRYAVRALRKSPGFALAVTLTLGLGIGANTAAFTIVNTLLLNPMPVVDTSDLVALHTVDTRSAAGSENVWPLSFPNLEDLQERNRVFTQLAAYTSLNTVTWMNGRTPERMFAEVVTANYFETLGLRPARGRFFLPEEGRTAGAHPVVVMGFAPWQHRFGGAPDIVGRTLVLNGTTFTVVGVAPERFRGVTALFGPDLWIPASMAEQVLPAQQRTSLRDRAALVFRRRGASPPRDVARAGRGEPEDDRDGPRARASRAQPRPQPGVAPPERAGLHGVRPPGGRARERPAHGNRGHRAADLLLQRRQPAAGAGRGAATGDRAAPGPRRGAGAARPPAPDRERAAGPRRGCDRDRAGGRRRRSSSRPSCRETSRSTSSSRGWTGACSASRSRSPCSRAWYSASRQRGSPREPTSSWA